jgi:hypothetical protein
MKSPSRYLALAMATAAFLASTGASTRQLGNGGTTYSGMSSQTQPENFLGRYVELTHAGAAANVTLLEALDMADDARQLASRAQGLDMKASTGDIGDAAAAAGATQRLVTQRLNAHGALGAANNATFAAGALALMQAAQDFTALTKNLGATKQALTNAGAPARVALYAARSAPDVAAQLRAEVKAVVAFADANQVTLAPEVRAAAAAM